MDRKAVEALRLEISRLAEHCGFDVTLLHVQEADEGAD